MLDERTAMSDNMLTFPRASLTLLGLRFVLYSALLARGVCSSVDLLFFTVHTTFAFALIYINSNGNFFLHYF